jgi:mono/diheme cytochrome c family protein
MGAHNRLMAVLFISLLAIAAANAQKPADRGDADAGRDLAEQACTGCHVVSADQPFPPLLRGRQTFGKSLTGQTSLRHRCVARLPLCH